MHCRVLVVGGGPAGATTARFLANEAVEVVLVEADLKHVKPCGGGIPEVAFREFDIPLPERHNQVTRVRIVSPGSRQLEITLDNGSLILVDRAEFDSSLRRLARDSGVVLIQGRLVGLEINKRHVNAEVALSEGKRITIKCEFVVAADGVNSSVRRLMGLPPVDHIYTISTKLQRVITDACEFWFSSHHAPMFYSWVFPSTGFTSIGTGTTAAAQARVFLKRFLQRRNVPNGLSAIRGYRIPRWKEDLYFVNRVFFTGDAAAHVLPFTYEGIYYAMASAPLVTEAITRNRPSLYKKLWRGRFHSRFRLMSALNRHFLKSDDLVERLFDIFQKPSVQKASMRLWLNKDTSKGALLSYIKLFRSFIH